MNIFERSARFRWFNNGKLETLISVNIFFFSFHSISGKVCPVRRIEYTSVSFFFSFLFVCKLGYGRVRSLYRSVSNKYAWNVGSRI